MQYKIRNGDSLLATVDDVKACKVTGLTPETKYSLTVSEYNGFNEGKPASVTFTTVSTYTVSKWTITVPKKMAVGDNVELTYLEYALGLVKIGTEPKGMFGGGNRVTVAAKVIKSNDDSSVIATINDFDKWPSGQTMKQIDDGSYAVYDGYKALFLVERGNEDGSISTNLHGNG